MVFVTLVLKGDIFAAAVMVVVKCVAIFVAVVPAMELSVRSLDVALPNAQVTIYNY